MLDSTSKKGFKASCVTVFGKKKSKLSKKLCYDDTFHVLSQLMMSTIVSQSTAHSN